MTELEYSEFLKAETDLEREASILALEHHGVKNMQWGVKNGPPYPISRGKDGKPTKTQKKKKASLLSKLTKKSKKKAASAKKASEKKKEESSEEIRKKVLESTDPKFIYKNRDLLTTQELQDRINRINKEADLKKLADGPKRKSNLKQAEEYMQSLGNMAQSIQKAYTAYNAISNGMQRNKDNAEKREKERVAAKKAEQEQKKQAAAQVKQEKQNQKASNSSASQKTETSSSSKKQESVDVASLLKGLKLSADAVSGITKSYNEMANADRATVQKYQQDLLRRAEEERQKRKKGGFKTSGSSIDYDEYWHNW